MLNKRHNVFVQLVGDFVAQNRVQSTEYGFMVKVMDVVGACPSCRWVWKVALWVAGQFLTVLRGKTSIHSRTHGKFRVPV